MSAKPKPERPMVEVWGIRDSEGRPHYRQANDTDMAHKGLNIDDYQPWRDVSRPVPSVSKEKKLTAASAPDADPRSQFDFDIATGKPLGPEEEAVQS